MRYDNTRHERAGLLFWMVISALIFAYFGFGTTWAHQSIATGQTLLFVVLLDYTFKGGAILMGLSAGVLLVHHRAGQWLYAITGLLTAVLFVVIALLDWLDTQHTALNPFLLLIFAAFNGFNAASMTPDLLASHATANGAADGSADGSADHAP